MPLASFRSFIGVVKDTTTVTLAASTNAGATTVTTAGGNVAASSTNFIWDGPKSESAAVSAGGGTSTLTVPALTYAHSAGVTITAQLTASVGPTDYIPVTDIKLVPFIAQLLDKGIRGSQVDGYGYQQGPRHDEITLGGPAYPDTFGWFLGAIFGSVDFTGGTPNTHTFGVQNTGNGQPTPVTIYDFDVVNTRAIASAKCDELQVKMDPAGLITYTAKFTGRESGVVTTPTNSFSTIAPVPAWQGTATIGGTALGTLVSFEVTFKRQQLDIITTVQGIQDPYSIFVGALKSTGKMVFVMEDDTQLLNYINNSQPTVVLTASNGTGASQVSIGFTFTKCNYLTANPLQVGKGYVELEVTFEGLGNTTDATTAGGGYSPGRAILKNAGATGHYQ